MLKIENNTVLVGGNPIETILVDAAKTAGVPYAMEVNWFKGRPSLVVPRDAHYKGFKAGDQAFNNQHAANLYLLIGETFKALKNAGVPVEQLNVRYNRKDSDDRWVASNDILLMVGVATQAATKTPGAERSEHVQTLLELVGDIAQVKAMCKEADEFGGLEAGNGVLRHQIRQLRAAAIEEADKQEQSSDRAMDAF